MPILLPALLITLGFALRATLGAFGLTTGRFYRSEEWRRYSWWGLALWATGILVGAVWAVSPVRPYDGLLYGAMAVASGAVLVLLSPLIGGGIPWNNPTPTYQLFAWLALASFAIGLAFAALGKQPRASAAKNQAPARTRRREILLAALNYGFVVLLAHLVHRPYCHHWAAYCSNQALVATVVQDPGPKVLSGCQCSWPIRALSVREDRPAGAIADGLVERKQVLSNPIAPEDVKAAYTCMV